MTITINGPNGVTINFPDDTPPDVMDRAMRQATGMGGSSAPAAEPKTGMLEAIGRAAWDTGTFGFGNALQDRERMKAARAEHPIASFVGDVVGVLPTLALGPAGGAARAAQAAGTLGRAGNMGANVVRAAEAALMPNLGARTALQAGATAAKVGVAQGALHGIGDSLTNPDASWSDVPLQAGKEAAIGGVGGVVIGPAVHGIGKAVGAVANRALPGLKETQRIASEWDSQGARDVIRHAGYDDVDLAGQLRRMTPSATPNISEAEARQVAARVLSGSEDAATVAQRMGKPLAEVEQIVVNERAIRSKYADLNLIEAVKTGDLRQLPHTGELRPEVITTRNMDQLARWAANTEGKGQNEAAHAFAARKDEMGALMQRDIDAALGSGSREADSAAIDAVGKRLGKRYDRLRDKAPNIDVVAMGGLERHPVMRKALDEAALNDLVRNPGQGLVRWQAADGTTRTDGLQTLTPANILDIHRILAANARSAFTEPAEARMAGLLKQHFTTFVDGVYSKHKALRQDFAQFKALQAATEHGVELAQLGKVVPKETADFLRAAQQVADQARTRIAQLTQQMATEQAAGAPARRLQYLRGMITRFENQAQPAVDRLDEARKAFGETLRQQIAMAPDPNAVTRRLLTQEGKARIMTVLGREDGQRFIETLYNKRTQQELGNKLYGNSDTAFKMQKNETMDALTNVVTGLMHLRPTTVVQGLGDLASNGFRQRRADQVNELMSRQGVDEVRRILESLTARQALQSTGNPIVRNPALIASPAVSAQASRDRKPKQERAPWMR